MTAFGPAAARIVDTVLEASVVGSFTRIGFDTRARIAGFADPLREGMTGKRVLVTGANSGLGLATTVAVLQAGATAIATTRSVEKTAALRDTITKTCGSEAASRLVCDELDLHRLEDVAAFASRHGSEPLHVLVHNAGALTHRFALTEDGLEETVQTHVLAPFLLTALLRGALESSGGAQVITVTSGGLYTQRVRDDILAVNAASFNGAAVYAAAKRAQVVMTSQWQRRFGGDILNFYATHPGWVDTPGLRRSLPGFVRALGPVLRDTTQGIDTLLYLCASAPDSPTGRVWHDRVARRTHRLPTTFARRGTAGQLWANLCRAADVDPYA